MNIFRNSKGQLLVVMPILVILIVGAILLTVNISKMCHEHIKIQTTADIAARDGALTQALALDSITVLNDTIIALYVEMVVDIECLFDTCWDPYTWEECEACWDDLESTYERIKKLQNMMDKIKKATPAAVEAAVIAGAMGNGASFGTVKISWASWNGINLNLKWSFGIPGVPGKIIDWIIKEISGLKGILIRDGSHVDERVNVTVWKNGAPAYGRAILGKNLTFPKMTAWASARPYWVGCPGHERDPISDHMNGWEQRISMITPAFWWDAKMIDCRAK